MKPVRSPASSCSVKLIRNIASFYSSIRLGKISPPFPAARKTTDILQGLSSLKASLSATANFYEPHFLALGQNLQTIYINANTLAGNTIDSVKDITGDSQHSALAGLRDKVRTSLGRMEDNQAAIDSNLLDLESQGQHLAALTTTTRDLNKIALYLRVAGINIGIEATRSEESRTMFSLTAQEVSQLGGKIITIAENIARDASHAHNVQLSVQQNISQKLNKLREYSTETEITVRNALEVIEQLLQNATVAMDQAALHSKTIAAQCGEIVVGIQFHDSMSQRLAHVIETFAEVLILLNGSPISELSPETPLPLEERMAAAYSLCKLQSTQIKQVITEIDSLHQQTLRSFALIDQGIRLMASAISRLSGENRENQSEPHSGDSFANLKTSLDSLIFLMNQGDALVADVRQGVHDASETSQRLLSFMNKINATAFEIKIQALNAIIKAAHLGDKGLTLVVLAHEMNTLSDTADKIVAGAAEVYRLLSAQTNQHLEKQEGADHKNLSLATAIDEIASIYSLFKTTSQTVAENAEALRVLTLATCTSLTFLPEMATRLKECHDEMEAILSGLKGKCRTSGKEAISSAIRNAENRYTMDQERVIHLQLSERLPSEKLTARPDVSQGPDSSIALIAAPAEEDSSVELFDTPTEAENRPESAIPPAEAIGQRQRKTEFSQAAKDAADLGENVELF